MKSGEGLYRVAGASLSMGGRLLLDIEHLVLPEGGVSCIAGPNGAGKSLLLSLLAGLRVAERGVVLYRGREVKEIARNGFMGKEVTLVHQQPYLFRGTVLSNVLYGMAGRDMTRAGKRLRAEELLERVGLKGFAGRRTGRLSAGETSRVALARALGCGASTLLLDEPTASVDRNGVPLLEGLIAEESARNGVTVIMSTHSMSQARRLGADLVYLRDGKVTGEIPSPYEAERKGVAGHAQNAVHHGSHPVDADSRRGDGTSHTRHDHKHGQLGTPGGTQ